MALLAFPRVHLLPSSSSSFSSFLRPVSRTRSFSLSAASKDVSVPVRRYETDDVSLVWFKHDLRLDDHPGLVAASRCRTVVPVYVFDHRILSLQGRIRIEGEFDHAKENFKFIRGANHRKDIVPTVKGLPDEMLELILFALEHLRKSLRDKGSDLLIEFGNAEDVILKLVREVKATHIFAEEEVEYDIQTVVNIVKESLSCLSFPWGSPQFVRWQTTIYGIKDLKKLPASHHEFQRLKFPLTTPLTSASVPELNIIHDRGTLPTFDDVKRYINGNPCKGEESWTAIKSIPAKTILLKEKVNQVKMRSIQDEGFEESKSGKSDRNSLASKDTERKRLKNSVFVSRSRNIVGGGTGVVLNALAAYLRYLEGTARDDWQEVHEKLRNAESRKGASFGALFGSALYLGIISRRRVHYEAIKYEKERNAGFLSPFGYSTATVAAAIDGVRSMEVCVDDHLEDAADPLWQWYWLLALKSQINSGERYSVRIWRWNGYLIQYTVVGHQGPAVLLVHGFGAFLEHYRDNISGIADDGNRVWAITLLGFGKSEKPNILYTELVWAELLRDFIVDVVGEPVHLIGNSIGGYFVALVAGLWPALVKSLVLINTAGSVIPGYSSVQLIEANQTSGFVWLGAQLLLLYLRSRARNILKNCYPINTDRVDDRLVNEILRASYDPGVLVVLESVFGFNLSIPLNYLLETFGGKVLVIQGMKDPLSKSFFRLSLLKEHCSSIMLRELDAGHCPHDELPEEVNCIICEWTRTTEGSLQPVQAI